MIEAFRDVLRSTVQLKIWQLIKLIVNERKLIVFLYLFVYFFVKNRFKLESSGSETGASRRPKIAKIETFLKVITVDFVHLNISTDDSRNF